MASLRFIELGRANNTLHNDTRFVNIRVDIYDSDDTCRMQSVDLNFQWIRLRD